MQAHAFCKLSLVIVLLSCCNFLFAQDNYYSPIEYTIKVPAVQYSGSSTDFTISIEVIPESVDVTQTWTGGFNYAINYSIKSTISNYNGSANQFWDFYAQFINSNTKLTTFESLNNVLQLKNGTQTYSNLQTSTMTYNGNISDVTTTGNYTEILTQMGYTNVNISVRTSGHETTLDGGGENALNDNTTSTAIVHSISLPVTLDGFSVSNTNNQVVLSWSTKSELNNKGFYLLHGTNTDNMVAEKFIASEATDGNSATTLNYQTIDNAPVSNVTNYYQLKQEDLDGKYTLSNIISFTPQLNISKNAIKLYPNPVTNNYFMLEGININSKIYKRKNEISRN